MNYGFINENDFINSLNNKQIKDVPQHLKEQLLKIFNCDENSILSCKKYKGHYKPDVYLKCNDIKINISIKSGDNISAHEELLEQFVAFLSTIGITNRTIKIIKFYHYGDGTTDGSGDSLLDLKYMQFKYSNYIMQANCELNNNKNYMNIIDRILFSGKFNQNHSIDFIYYGTDKIGFLLSKEQIINYLVKQKSMYLNCLHVGPFTYQPASRKTNKVKYCQFKWKSLLSDITKMIQ